MLVNSLWGLKGVQSPCPLAVVSVLTLQNPPTPASQHGAIHVHKATTARLAWTPAPQLPPRTSLSARPFHPNLKGITPPAAGCTHSSWERNSGDFTPVHHSQTPHTKPIKPAAFWVGCLPDVLFLRQSHPPAATAAVFPCSSLLETGAPAAASPHGLCSHLMA